MNKENTPEKLAETISREHAKMVKRVAFLEYAMRDLIPLLSECSDTMRPDLLAGIPYFYVYNREDLSVLMRLAPQWSKSKCAKSIEYTAEVHGVRVHLMAYDNALPPTCRVVRTVTQVPAKEAHEITEESIVCELGQEVTA